MAARIAFMGDVMLGRLVNNRLKIMPAEYVFGNTLPVLAQSSLRICNLECAISTRSDRNYTPKAFHFRTDPKNVAALKAANIDIVSLANNHVLDFGNVALADTLRSLDDASIKHAGAGLSPMLAKLSVIHEVDGVKLAFVAVTDNEPSWEAWADKPGVYFCPIDIADRRSIELFAQIRDLKSDVDIVIISLHWGGNWGYGTPVNHVIFARALVDAGADIIYGHSPHVFRGVEIYHGKPIMYSVGNFIDDYAIDEFERNDESFIFIVSVAGRRVTKLQLIPTLIDNLQAKLAGARSPAIAARMGRLCRQLGTNTYWDDVRGDLQIPIKLAVSKVVHAT